MNEIKPAALDEATPLADKVAWLCRPTSYPQPVRRLERIETHMSWVFLTDAHAYKLKKPVRYAYLDFSTLDARQRACAEELRLNRRLAPDVYLDVVALRRAPDGALALEGPGEAVEWLIKMRRLPAERMLDARIQAGTITAGEIQALAARLAAFYRETPRIGLSGTEYRARIAAQVQEHCVALEEPALGLPPAAVIEACTRLEVLLVRAAALIEGRASAGRIVEGHGDLRPEHVCLERQPVVIDCLEFNREFRIVDPVDELAFLAMECERLGAPNVGPALLAAYAAASGDAPPAALVHFYKALRAVLRAKLSIWHTRELPRAAWHRWSSLACAYIDTAGRESHAALSTLEQLGK
jgi:aminoglycoside phosphotransferase family enzyme